MKIDRAGFPFIGATVLPAVIAALARRPVVATGFALLGGFMTYFFRDPDRNVPQAPGLVVAPADGRVMIAGSTDHRWAPPGDWLQITIFLSPMDVHMNRTPVEGRVTKIHYRPGRFLPAYDEASNDNELNELWIDSNGRTVVVRQVVGILARRIVCRVAVGQQLARGERIGLMKFGSRMDVFLPPDAELRVSVGEHTVAGETILATMGRPGAR